MVWFLLAIVSVTAIVLGVTCGWLISEHRKKFAMLGRFFSEPEDRLELRHAGGADAMRTVVLKAQYPFKALVAIRFDMPVVGNGGFDPFALVESNAEGVAMFAAWFGPGPGLFYIRIDGIHPNHVKMEVYDGIAPECGVVCRPHWYQRFL